MKKYIVLQDFWLRDVCLRKGKIITEPVSKRWIELRLVKPYCPCKNITVSDVANSDVSEIESDIVAVDVIPSEVKIRKRGRPKKVENE